MPDRERKPAYRFKPNQSVTIRITKNWGKGVSTSGEWFGWTGEIDGVEETFFADPNLHQILKGYSLGTSLIICESHKQGTKGKYTEWLVKDAILGDDGGPAHQPPPKPDLTTEEARAEFIDRMGEVMTFAANKAQAIADKLNESPANSIKVGEEFVKSVAITLYLDYQKNK